MTTPDHTTSSTHPNGVAKLLARFERAPKLVVFVAVLALTLGALWTPGAIGACLTLALAAVGAYLLYATWSRQSPPGSRLARVVVLLALAALGAAKFLM